MNADGSNVRQLTNIASAVRYVSIYVSWSPDGNQFAVSSNQDGDSEVYVTDVTQS